jgi:hypothetical protein
MWVKKINTIRSISLLGSRAALIILYIDWYGHFCHTFFCFAVYATCIAELKHTEAISFLLV